MYARLYEFYKDLTKQCVPAFSCKSKFSDIPNIKHQNIIVGTYVVHICSNKMVFTCQLLFQMVLYAI
jgi:hypothetical protein